MFAFSLQWFAEHESMSEKSIASLNRIVRGVRISAVHFGVAVVQMLRWQDTLRTMRHMLVYAAVRRVCLYMHLQLFDFGPIAVGMNRFV